MDYFLVRIGKYGLLILGNGKDVKDHRHESWIDLKGFDDAVYIQYFWVFAFFYLQEF
jgi:hypothetical protein